MTTIKFQNSRKTQKKIKIMEKIFDKWILEYLKSPKAKETTTQINKHLEQIIDEEDKYLV
jgi:hypothetical protein